MMVMTKNIMANRESNSRRNFSIDTFRVFSIFFVILHHQNTFQFPYNYYDGSGIFRFLYCLVHNIRLLPFFFIAAGYFFGKAILRGEAWQKRFITYNKRLLRLFCIWTFIYAFTSPHWLSDIKQYGFFQPLIGNITTIIQHPFNFFMTGTNENLWYFPALIIALTILSIFVFLRIERYIIPFGFILYLTALLGKSYSVLPFGYHVDFEMRQGPFVSTLFVAMGWLLSKKDDYKTKTAVTLIFTGLLMMLIEITFLWFTFRAGPTQEYLFGTIPFCLGVFWLALSQPDIGKGTFLPELGKLTLGVYVVHILVGKLLVAFGPFVHPVLWDVLEPVVIYCVSILFTIFLKNTTFTKAMVN